ncbi:HEPN domain-containing protein [Aeromonas caviae]|uniref:ApeA N-terminal domain 1-containing protein n=1 Tax=Aeromonas caviae TaxID=648 RepID=UPI0038D214A7
MTEYSHFDEHDFFGEFFPDKDNFSHRFPAKVIYSPSEGLILEYLISDSSIKMHHEFLHGVLNTGEACTLIGPFDFVYSTNKSGPVIYTKSGRQSFRHLIIGDYIHPESKYNKCSFTISGMQEFFYSQGFMSDLKHSEKPIKSINLGWASLNVVTAASFSLIDRKIINLIHSRNNNALKELSDAFELVKEKYQDAYFSLREEMSFSFYLDSKDDKTINEISMFSYDIASLFSILNNRPAFPETITILYGKDTYNVMSVRVLTGMSLEQRTINMAKKKSEHRHMPINDTNVSLDKIIPIWLSNTSRFNVIATLYQYETGFMTLSSVYGLIILLCTHIEDINAYICGGSIDKKRKYSLPIEHYGSEKLIRCIYETFNSSMENIGTNISDLRNELAHSDREKNLMNQLDINHYIVICEALKLIVVTHVFHLIGIDLKIAHRYQDEFLLYIEK